MRQIFPILFLMCLIIYSCQDEPADPTTDCDKLIVGLANYDKSDVADEINFISEDFFPASSSNDSIGHEANLTAFTRRLRSTCANIEASVIGYATIKTNPPKSEVLLEIFTVDSTFERILEINTPSDNVLSFSDFHQ